MRISLLFPKTHTKQSSYSFLIINYPTGNTNVLCRLCQIRYHLDSSLESLATTPNSIRNKICERKINMINKNKFLIIKRIVESTTH